MNAQRISRLQLTMYRRLCLGLYFRYDGQMVRSQSIRWQVWRIVYSPSWRMRYAAVRVAGDVGLSVE